MKNNLVLLTGFLLAAGSIYFSIFHAFHYWYSFYVIGAFIFFGSVNLKLGNDTAYTKLAKGKIKQFTVIFLVVLLLGFIADILYGRMFADLWHYPYLNGLLDFFVPVLIYYPFGGLQIYELYYLLRRVIPASNKQMFTMAKPIKDVIMYFFIFTAVVSLIVGPLNYLLYGKKHGDEIVMLVIMLTFFSTDALVYLKNKSSILLEALQGNLKMMITMILTWLFAMLLTEFPNTFSWEWIYTVPFTNLEIAKINILIMTFGWFSLVFLTIRGIDFARIVLNKELLTSYQKSSGKR